MVDKQAVTKVFDRGKPLSVKCQGDLQVQKISDDGVVSQTCG